MLRCQSINYTLTKNNNKLLDILKRKALASRSGMLLLARGILIFHFIFLCFYNCEKTNWNKSEMQM